MKRGKTTPSVPQDEWLISKLSDPEMAVEYLNAALAEGDQPSFMLALRDVAKAHGGVSAMARDSGMNRVALSRALSKAGNPELKSLIRILDASGFRFAIVPKGSARRNGGKSRSARQST